MKRLGKPFVRSVKVGIAAISVAALPSVALAVNVSSDDGSGNQYWYVKYSNGAKVTGNLRSTSGAKVYYSGRVVYNNYTDQKTRTRTAGDTRPTRQVNRR